MKKYYPAECEVKIRVTATELGTGTKLSTFDRKTGEAIVIQNNKIYTSDCLYRNKVGELFYTHPTYGVFYATRWIPDPDKILYIAVDGAWISDGTTRRQTKEGSWGKDATPTHGLNMFVAEDNIVLVGTYAPVKSSTAESSLWLSRDYGENFERIFNSSVDGVNPENCHLHGCAYDKYRKRIWYLIGDDESAQLAYSDDWGVTRKTVELQPGIIPQFIGILVLPTGIVVATDTTPDGFLFIPMDNSRTYSHPDNLNMHFYAILPEEIDHLMSGWGMRCYGLTDEYPHKLLIPWNGSGNFSNFKALYYGYNGKDWFQIAGNTPADGNKTPLYTGYVEPTYIAGITPEGFKIGEQDASNIAWGLGKQWNGTAWEDVVIELDLPKWVAIE